MRKVLILGSTGLIGHQVYSYLNKFNHFQLSNLSYRNKLNENTILLDAKDVDSLVNQIKVLKPDFIVNCIGVLIKQSNDNPESAIFLNAYLPHVLSRLSSSLDAKFIHMSTDCVFSGYKKGFYTENDYKDGKDIYAKTKGLGEINNGSHLTIRTSVVGPELKINGGELFNWFMTQPDKKVNGYINVKWSGVSSIELAKAVKWAIENEITGLYHVTNNQTISKYELLELFKKYTNKKIQITPFGDFENDKTFVDTRGQIDYEIPSYNRMIFEMVQYISENKSLYPQYQI
tara:strand:+ start:274 stop:1137 length:864 start_codon:yes stop_codon:yes gene_type:complete